MVVFLLPSVFWDGATRPHAQKASMLSAPRILMMLFIFCSDFGQKNEIIAKMQQLSMFSLLLLPFDRQIQDISCNSYIFVREQNDEQ